MFDEILIGVNEYTTNFEDECSYNCGLSIIKIICTARYRADFPMI